MKEYTYFTSKYFISRPLWGDLSTYLNGITEKPDLSDSGIEVFKRGLCFDARNDFFDLRTFIKDHIVSFNEENQPVVEFSAGAHDNIYKARLHKAVTVLFEQNYMSNRYSKWQENEELHKYLFGLAEKIFASKTGEIFPEPVEDSRNKDTILKNDMTKDFYGFLHRHGVLKFHGKPQKVVLGQNVAVSEYTSSGEAPEDFPDELHALTAFEQRFTDSLKLYSQYFVELSNTLNESMPDKLISIEELLEYSDSFTTKFSEDDLNPHMLKRHHKEYYNLIKAKSPHPYQRETMEESTREITNGINDFKKRLPQVVSKKILSRFIRFGLKQGQLSDPSGLFKDPSGQIRNSFSGLNPIVVFKPDLSQQVLLVNNQKEQIHAIRDVLEKHESTYCIVSFQDDGKITRTKGLVVVCTDSPQNIKVSITKLFKKMDDFFNTDNMSGSVMANG